MTRNARKQGTGRTMKHQHVDSCPSSSTFSSSTSLSATGVRIQKTKDASARNTQYAGMLFSILCVSSPTYSIAMTLEQRQVVMDLREPPSPDDSDWEMLDDVLHGDEALDISHEGGEFEALTKLRGKM
jgi:hypothetical protein